MIVFHKVMSQGKRHNRTDRNMPHKHEIIAAKQIFKGIKAQHVKDSENIDRRHQYIAGKQMYQKVIYHIKNRNKDAKLHDITIPQKADPKIFWNKIKKTYVP